MVPNSDMTRTEISGAFARSTSRPPVTAVTAAGGATPRPPYRQLLGRRQSGANPVEISLTDGCVRLVHSLGELLEGEPPGEQVVLQPRHRLVPIGVGDPLVHARHGPRGAATVTGA